MIHCALFVPLERADFHNEIEKNKLVAAENDVQIDIDEIVRRNKSLFSENRRRSLLILLPLPMGSGSVYLSLAISLIR